MTRTPTNLDDLRRMAVTRTLSQPTTLVRAIDTLGFVQADPIRAPARAQDLILRPRVRGYRAGDLERQYSSLPVEEDVFINYGFVTRSLQALMHPRSVASPSSRNGRAQAVLAFVREHGAVHPRDVDAHFSHGTVTNYWGGSSSATTRLLEALHYKGLLRVVRRDAGIRVYAPHRHRHGTPPATPAERRTRLDALVDIIVRKYGPLPSASLSFVVRRLRYAVPQWQRELPAALDRAHRRLTHTRVDGVVWYWPSEVNDSSHPDEDDVRLLAPFDPVVWDRRRFEMLWGWAYRFEGYTPVSKRKLGYYALPLLWRDRIVGWGNVSIRGSELNAALGYVHSRPPRDRGFSAALEAELERMRTFLRIAESRRADMGTREVS